MKKRKVRGAIMVEVALAFVMNMVLLLGGLESGWYLYARQALSGAVREAARVDHPLSFKRCVDAYLVGLDFSDDFVDSVVVTVSSINLGGSPPRSIRKVTATVPISKVLIFGGELSGLLDATGGANLTVEGFEREE